MVFHQVLYTVNLDLLILIELVLDLDYDFLFVCCSFLDLVSVFFSCPLNA